MKRLYTLYIIALLAAVQPAFASEPLRLTLQEAVALARTNSVEAQQALAQLRSSYWSYRSYRADLLPEVSLNATLPSYRRSYSTYQESTGAYTYVKNDNLQSNAGLSITQNLWFTGGTLTLTSSLDYMKQLTGDRQQRFMTLPVALRLNQPILGTNSMKWRRRIEPLRYAEAKADFLTATEQVTLQTIRLYFNLLLDRENVLTAKQNLQSTEQLLAAGKVKRKMGQISENELMQLELETLKARSTLTSYESSRRSSMYALRTHLAIEEEVDLEPAEPEMLSDIQLDYGQVLDKALLNHSHALNLRRRQLQADYNVAQARGNMRQINLYAQVGYTGHRPAGRRRLQPPDRQPASGGGAEHPPAGLGQAQGKPARGPERPRRGAQSDQKRGAGVSAGPVRAGGAVQQPTRAAGHSLGLGHVGPAPL